MFIRCKPLQILQNNFIMTASGCQRPVDEFDFATFEIDLPFKQRLLLHDWKQFYFLYFYTISICLLGKTDRSECYDYCKIFEH